MGRWAQPADSGGRGLVAMETACFRAVQIERLGRTFNLRSDL
jgi:hypothetical protein